MTPGYFTGLVQHLIERASNPTVAKVETYAQAGAVGPGWGSSGLKVTTSDGQATFVSIVRGSSPTGDPTNLPTEYVPEV